MVQLLRFVCLLISLSSCARKEHYYVTDAPYALYRTSSNQSITTDTIPAGDTIVSRTRLRLANGRLVRIRHRTGIGYVRYIGQTYAFAAPRIAPAYYVSSSYSALDMSRPVYVRAHTRRLASGKVVNVRAHTRSRPGSRSSSSSSRSYRSSGSSYRSSSSRSSGSSYRGSSSRSSGGYRSSGGSRGPR